MCKYSKSLGKRSTSLSYDRYITKKNSLSCIHRFNKNRFSQSCKLRATWMPGWLFLVNCKRYYLVTQKSVHMLFLELNRIMVITAYLLILYKARKQIDKYNEKKTFGKESKSSFTLVILNIVMRFLKVVILIKKFVKMWSGIIILLFKKTPIE